jgi:hypothetical protein
VIGRPERVAYGPADIEKDDIYRTKRPNAPTMVFIHGGAWRGGRSADFALYAEVFVKAGANFTAVDFNNVIETRGDLFPMVDQCRRAVAWSIATPPVCNNRETYLCGRFRQSPCRMRPHHRGTPRNPQRCSAGSGMYDAVRPPSAATTSDRRNGRRAFRTTPPDKIHALFLHDARNARISAPDYTLRRSGAGKPIIIGKGYNHYEMGETRDLRHNGASALKCEVDDC